MAAKTTKWKETRDNLKRAASGGAAVDAYVKRRYLPDDGDALDLVTEVLHWVAARGESPERLLKDARTWFNIEREGRC